MVRDFRGNRLLVTIIMAALVTSACQAAAPTSSQALASSGAQATPVKGGTLRIGLGTEPLSFDPANYLATTDLIITRMIFDGLVSFDASLHVIPGLATSWTQIDTTTWRFKLRQGVKFSDGSAFSAKDVKASLERDAAKPSGSTFVGFIQQVNIIDDFTVDVKTKNPVGPFLTDMATEVAAITTEAQTKLPDASLLLSPIGTGPFMLKEFTKGQRTVLVPNPNYWGTAPLLDQVNFIPIPDSASRYAALKSGQVDVIEDPPTEDVQTIQQGGSGLTLDKSPASRDLRIGFQMQNPVMANLNLRAAIAYAIDAKSIDDYVVNGLERYANNGWLPSEIFTPNPPLSIPFDLAKAKQLLTQAGYPNGLTLELDTPTGRYLGDTDIAQAVQQQLKAIGITVNIKTMQWAAYLSYVGAHSGQMFIIGWANTSGDPAIAFRQNFFSTSSFNFAGLNDPAMDQDLTQAEQTTDQASRQTLYQAATKILFDQVVMKPIYWKNNLFAMNTDVKGFVATPNELIDVTGTWIAAK